MKIGDCALRRWTDPATLQVRLFVDRADPIIRVSGELLSQMRADADQPWATITDNGVLTIRATNRTVIYKINWDDFDPATASYLAQWPD